MCDLKEFMREAMTTKELANKIVDHCRKGEVKKAYSELYGQNVVSLIQKTEPCI